MPIEDISHVKGGGVLVTFRHPCDHLSNPLWYERLSDAEAALPNMDAVPCWPCRTLAAGAEVDHGQCQECGKALPYICITPLCDDCLDKPAGEQEVPT